MSVLLHRRGILAKSPSSASGAVFVNDTFTDTASTGLGVHVGETGATWTRHPSYAAGDTNFFITPTGRISSSSGNGGYYASGTPATAEYDVEAPFVCASNTGGIGICGRVATAADTMYLVHREDASTWALYKGVAGVFTQLGTYTQTLTVSQTYQVKLQIRDAAKKVFIDGVERISSADNAVTGAGRIMVRSFVVLSDTTGPQPTSLTATNA